MRVDCEIFRAGFILVTFLGFCRFGVVQRIAMIDQVI